MHAHLRNCDLLRVPFAAVIYILFSTRSIPSSLIFPFIKLGHVSSFEDGGEVLLEVPDLATAPRSNTTYALASGDLNPIHVNGAIALLAGLPTTITHGMWTSANGAGTAMGRAPKCKLHSFV